MGKLEDVNYQPLAALDHAWSESFKASFKGVYLAGWGVAVILAIGGLLTIDLPLMFFGVFIVIFIVAMIYQNTKNKIWISFAVANRWTIDAEVSPGMLVPLGLQYGHSQHLSAVIQAQIDNTVANVYEYDTTTGEGKYQTTHYYTIAQVILPEVLPHIMLRNKKGGTADINDDFADSQSLQLEGDFGDYFKLEISKNEQVDVLEVLTPDVMQRLVSYAQAEDIEIANNELFFICRNDQRDAKHIQQLLTSVSELTGQIVENIRLTTVQPVASQQQPVVAQSQPASQPVAQLQTVMQAAVVQSQTAAHATDLHQRLSIAGQPLGAQVASVATAAALAQPTPTPVAAQPTAIPITTENT